MICSPLCTPSADEGGLAKRLMGKRLLAGPPDEAPFFPGESCLTRVIPSRIRGSARKIPVRPAQSMVEPGLPS